MDRGLLWKNILKELKPVVSEGQFASFLKTSSLVSLENNTVTIGVNNAIALNMLQARLLPVIKQVFDKHTSQDNKIVFVVNSASPKTKQPEILGPLFAEENKPTPKVLPRVRPDYTFETLAVSGSNQLAVASAQRVAEDLGKSYNPLFIYGPVGVGKTHLMQAIANEVYKKNPDLKIIYITSEEFTNEVVDAIRSNNTAHMKKRFRSANLLIIDDIQFIAGKDKSQEELFHTFNTLIDNGAQIALSSDKPPSEIKKLEARLSSRFAGGLTVDIESPDFEMRTAILLKKAEKRGFELPMEVAKMIAEKEQDTRSLEGALTMVITQLGRQKGIITTEAASDVLKLNSGEAKRNIHPDEVIKVTCEFYNVKPTQIKGPKRNALLVKARQVIMYILNKNLRLTLVDVGNILGGRDHTTIMYGVEKMEKAIVENPQINEEIMGITKQLRG